ncbi:MAG TPA: ACT domain-containing protein [Thermoplasmataceae archaeon]|nr:ACT domain-containing protein [Thermoplasmatales archaeon AK]HLH86287.1 ACT domain-containing protein [Thermoplasmataceae archaeon]
MLANEAETVASKVRAYLEHYPDLWKSLDLGIVNLSALARIISREEGIDNIGAIIAALKRIPKSGYSNLIHRNEIKNSTIETRSNITVLILRPSTENIRLLINVTRNIVEGYTDYRIIQAAQGCGLVINDTMYERIKKQIPKNEIIDAEHGLGEIILISTPEIKNLRGYVAYAASLLANSGINIVQIISFYSDITFILNSEDVLKAMKLFLNEKQRGGDKESVLN